MSGIDQPLERIFTDLMPGETVPPRERTRVNCLRWDSLMQLNLILAIEQEFGISIGDEEAIELNSFEVARLLVQSKCPAGRVHG